MPKKHVKKSPRQARVFTITEHAQAALAERMDKTHRHLGPRQLGDLLDRDLRDRSDEQKEEWWEKYDGNLVKSTIYRLNHFCSKDDGRPLYAVTRPARNGTMGVVTVLTELMVGRNKINGYWGRTKEEVGKPKMRQGLLQSMKAEDLVKIAQETHKPKTISVPKARAHRTTNLTPIDGGKQEPKKEEPVKDLYDNTYLVAWIQHGEDKLRKCTHPKMRELVQQLATDTGVPNESIEVYIKQNVSIAVKVEVQVG